MFVLNGNQKKILYMMKKCGLNEYESKTYFTLLISGKSKAWDLYKRSSVPNSKIYPVIEELKRKGLVEIEGWKPKMISPKDFSKYLRNTIKTKQKEIESLEKFCKEVSEMVYSLKPIAEKFENKYRVFEPKYRRL